MSRFEVPSIVFSNKALPKRLSLTILEPIISAWVNFTKRACKASKKLTDGSSKPSLAKPRQLLATISHKTFNLVHKKKANDDEQDDEEYDFGDGGLWQRSILMGGKCQPLDFPGVIYYDIDGKRLSELPMKSPASPLPNYVLSKNKE